MSKLLASAAIAVSVLASSMALAAEKIITLAVKNMYCADCPLGAAEWDRWYADLPLNPRDEPRVYIGHTRFVE